MQQQQQQQQQQQPLMALPAGAEYLSCEASLSDPGCGSFLGLRRLRAEHLGGPPDGRIGPLQIDVSTEAQIRAFAGKPARVERDFWPGTKGQFGHSLQYRCGPGCLTNYSINNATGRLSDYWTKSPHFRTERGSHVGMSATQAASLEGRKLLLGCGFPTYLYLRSDNDRVFVLAIWKGRVDSIGYLGPHTVYYDGLC